MKDFRVPLYAKTIIATAMIKRFHIKDWGPIAELDCSRLSNINLFIGANGVGKSMALKSLYVAIKSIEQNGRGMEQRTLKELLANKLHWTFQTESIGSLVRKGKSELSFEMETEKRESLEYSFGTSTSKKIVNLTSTFAPREANSVFIPAKEVLSLKDNIEESRSDKYNAFGFDDTYYDLARALTPQMKGRNYKCFADARAKLGDTINGRIEYDEKNKRWIFRNKELGVISIALTSEGIKKISIIDVLLGNHYLTPDSIIIIDEPESALHPRLVSTFVEIVCELSMLGIQFFIASHSYFVIKKLYLLAHQRNVSIPVFSFENGGCARYDLKDEMPQNEILEESVRLYSEEIEL